MIVTTTIDLSPNVYRYFLDTAKEVPDLTTEELMSMALTLYRTIHQSQLTMSKAEWDNWDRLLQNGTLKQLL